MYFDQQRIIRNNTMAYLYPELENIQRLKVPPTQGEWALVNYLKDNWNLGFFMNSH